jgi:hypothetical protein
MNTSDHPTTLAASITLPEASATSSNIFHDLDALKLSLQDVGLSGSQEIMNRVPVRRPTKKEFFRVRPGKENCFTTVIYEDQALQSRDFYFVTPAMIPKLRAVTDVFVVSLVQFYTKQKVFGIFPLKMGTDATASNGWYDTAMAAAEMAKTRWLRIHADMALSGYRIFAAEDQSEDPVWPEAPFNELLDLAFKDRVIASEDHPVFNKILGRI